MTVIVPNYAVTDVRQSLNFTPGRSKRLEYILIHWWGSFGQSHDGVVSYLCRAAGNTSAHYVVSAGRVTQIVSDNDTAWHCPGANANGIGLECRPEMSNGDFETVAQLIAAIWSEHGYLPLRGHRDFYATACPGQWYDQLAALEARARAIQGGAPAAIQAPSTGGGSSTTTAPPTKEGSDMHLIATKLSDGSWSYALVTESHGAKTLDAQQRGAYIKMLGDAAGYPWDWYWLLIREAWERHNQLAAMVGREVDEAADSIVARLKEGLAPAEVAA